MRYDLKIEGDKSDAIHKFKQLLDKEVNIELKEVRKSRTLAQNRYLHVCLSMFSIECGYTIEESKTHLKRNCPFMRYEKDDQVFLKRTSKMNTKELTEFIEWILDYAGQRDIEILSADDYLQNQFSIDREIQKYKSYL